VKPVRCQPHPIYLPRSGAKRVPQTAVLGWRMAGPLPAYKGPPWPRRRAEDDPASVTPEEIAAWRGANPEATCSERTARVLCWLTREFAPR
jgi:hypothetical protein